MEQKLFEKWFTKLGRAWCNRNPEEAVNLFSKDVEYYESVFEKPCKNWDAVYKLWKIVPKNQKNITFNFKIISTSGNLAVANWKVKRTFLPSNEQQNIDGIFIIKLNNNGICNYFKQWRTVQNK